MTESIASWFGVRCVFELDPEAGADTDLRVFEERGTVWQARSFGAAIELAEAGATDYAATVDAKYLGLAQAYRVDAVPTHGAEVFPLIRQSELAPRLYLSTFFDTGQELRAPTNTS
jgi:hypothetical protein